MISIYIHWPFCLSKCPYCDFNSHVVKTIDHNDWLKSYLHELKLFLSIYQGKKIKSIFFGGGTPSLMEIRVVEAVLNFIKANAICDADLEVTLEMNPTSMEIEKLQGFALAGVNRVSIGIQSLNDQSLKFLGRNHSASEALRCLEFAHKYFDNVSFDLIYGLPHQSISNWQEECKLAMKYVTNHVSLYQLMIEPDTKFYSLYKAGKLKPHDSNTLYDMYDYTNQELEKRGLFRYEISNYAKPSFESRHNLVYWNYDEYLGIGPGAHSRLLESNLIYEKYVEQKGNLNSMERNVGHGIDEIDNVGKSARIDSIDVDKGQYVRNKYIRNQYQVYAMDQISNPAQWLKNMDKRNNIVRIDKKEVAKEMLMMSLRTKYGLSLQKFEKYTALVFQKYFADQVQGFNDSNLLIIKDGYVILTDQGMALNSYIVKEFFSMLDNDKECD